jgi:hypothetical protein
MDPLALVLLSILCTVILFGSRVAAAVALIASACLMTMNQMVVVGPFHFHFFQLIILAGFVRAVARRELFDLRRAKIDVAVLAWLVVLVVTSWGHRDPNAHFVTILGTAFNTVLVYFLFRAFVRNVDDVTGVTKWFIGILLVLAVTMVAEKASGHSAWERFGIVVQEVRREKFRAAGPFNHAILAGSVGAAAVPLLVALRSRWRTFVMAGIVACLVIIWACASSGPLVALASGIFALCLWPYREYRRLVVWTGLAGLVLLEIVMKDHVWYLMARVDLVGGSTGWYRARLIDQALTHIGEWWLAGSDYTRHWMPTGVSWSPDHSDLVNHYVALGVTGGVGLVIAHIVTLTLAFKAVGHTLDRYPDASQRQRFLVWALGSVLFGHTINSLSISYFDQSIVLVYFILACIGSLDTYPDSLPTQPGVVPEAKRRGVRVARLAGAISPKRRFSAPVSRPTRHRG